MWEFGTGLSFNWVMGGLMRRLDGEYRDSEAQITSTGDPFPALTAQWLDVAAESGMPLDPRAWRQAPISGSHPACMAVKAAAEQGPEAAYACLRRLREGLLCERRKLDHADALIGLASEVAMDHARFVVDLRSHAITEAFGNDLEEVRAVPEDARAAGAVRVTEGRERVPFPSAVFRGEGGTHAVWGVGAYEELRGAAIAAGAQPVNEGPLEPVAAVERFGRCATAELVALAQDRPRPVVEAELWAAARDWRLKPVPVLTGTLWDRA